MQKVRQLITDTRKWKNIVGTDIEKNARSVMVYGWKVIEAMDIDGDIFRDISVKARSNRGAERGKKQYGPEHLVEMRFYGEDEYDSKAWVSCDCEYFKYTCEVALYNKDSSDIIHSNGEDPNIRNPKQIGILCKHLVAALRAGAVKRPVTKSLVKKQIEVERKENQAKEREEERKAKEKAKQEERKAKEKEAKDKRDETRKARERDVAKKKAIEQARKDREKARRERLKP